MTPYGKTPKMILAATMVVMLASPVMTTAAMAMGGTDTWASDGTDLSAVSELVEAGKYDMAIDKIGMMLKDSPDNADLFNYLAYSQRKLGDFASAGQNYERALMIDPEHVGALEYQGELFLQTNRPAMANENLERLKQICGTDCDEYKELLGKISN